MLWVRCLAMGGDLSNARRTGQINSNRLSDPRGPLQLGVNIESRLTARDIRAHLADAVRQLPHDLPSVVHVGLETLDGVAVEAERYRRIFNTVSRFDVSGKPLSWVFCHLFQSYAPPDQGWVLDETVYYFATASMLGKTPLEHFAVIVPETEMSSSGVHWLRDPP